MPSNPAAVSAYVDGSGATTLEDTSCIMTLPLLWQLHGVSNIPEPTSNAVGRFVAPGVVDVMPSKPRRLSPAMK